MGIKNACKTAWEAASDYYLFPWGLKRIAIALALQQGIHLGAGILLYPGISDSMKEMGFSEELARENTAFFPIVVRTEAGNRNALQRLHALTDFPTIFGILAGIGRDNESRPDYGSMLSFLGCTITLPQSGHFSLNAETVTRLGLSPADLKGLTLMHERGHCSYREPLILLAKIANFGLSGVGLPIDNFVNAAGNTQERDSDLHALRTYEQAITGQDEGSVSRLRNIQNFLLYFRAFATEPLLSPDMDIKHDTALQLDAHLRRSPIPSYTEIRESRNELSGYILSYIERTTGKIIPNEPTFIESYINTGENFVTVLSAVRSFLTETNTSPLAIRRAQLYLDAYEYFSKPGAFLNLQPAAPAPQMQ